MLPAKKLLGTWCATISQHVRVSPDVVERAEAFIVLALQPTGERVSPLSAGAMHPQVHIGV